MSKNSLRGHAPSLLATLGMALGVTANLLGASCDPSVTSSAAPLKSLSVNAEARVVLAGSTAQMFAIAVYPNGTSAELTNQVRWSSSSSRVATVSNDGNSAGLVLGVAAGTVVISAQLNGVSGSAQLEVRN